jgi:hypothetical protein
MGIVRDTLGRPVAEGGIWITLRPDLTGGVSLGGTASIEPGETRRVPASLALQLLNTQRACRAVAPVVVVEAEGGSAPVDVSGAPAAPASATRKRKEPARGVD